MRSFVLVLFIALAVSVSADDKFSCLQNALGYSSGTEMVNGDYDVRKLLTMYEALETSSKDKVQACKLNLAPAMARCESAMGKGACEQISPAAIHVKCDSRFKRTGCCHCGMNCPTTSWREDEYHCYKPASYTTLVYLNELSCGANCEEIAGRFVKKCPEGLKRVGLQNCIAVCPFGWQDEGARCRKPAAYRLPQPFYWANGDN